MPNVVLDTGYPAWSAIGCCSRCGSLVDRNDRHVLVCSACGASQHRECSKVSAGQLESVRRERYLCDNCDVCSDCGYRVPVGSPYACCRECRRVFHFPNSHARCVRINECSKPLAYGCEDCWRCPSCIWCKCRKGGDAPAQRTSQSTACCGCFPAEKSGHWRAVRWTSSMGDGYSARATARAKRRCCSNSHEGAPYACPCCSVSAPMERNEAPCRVEESSRESATNDRAADGTAPQRYPLFSCILCRQPASPGEYLQPLSPVAVADEYEAVSVLNVPDLFIHQRCLFYSSLMGLSERAVLSEIARLAGAACSRCGRGGAVVYCAVCRGSFHVACHGPEARHKLCLGSKVPQAVRGFSISRRALKSLFQLLGIEYHPDRLVLRQSNRLISVANSAQLRISSTTAAGLDELRRLPSDCARISFARPSVAKTPKRPRPAGPQPDDGLLVALSGIAGVGVIAGGVFMPGGLVVEYVGEVIGKALANRREKMYRKRKLGCYMFKIDNDCIVDATLIGNKARFINHSCSPNCRARIFKRDGKKRIGIFCLRRIEAGEEFCYDYKLPLEETKISCKCGSSNCREFMN